MRARSAGLSGGRQIRNRRRLLRRRRIVRTSRRFESVRFGRAPRWRFVFVYRCSCLKRRIDNAPCFLDVVFASEQRPVTRYGISEDAFVGGHLTGGGMTGEQHLNRLQSWFINLRHRRHTKGDSYLGTDAETEMIRRYFTFANYCGRFSETSEHLGSRDRQVFSRSDVERNAFPTPGVDLKFDNRKRLGLRVGIHAWFFAITAELPSNNVIRRERRNGFQDFGLFVANGLTVVPHRRFHAEVAEHLEHMILDHVPHRSRRIVECASTLD